mmetsp:Transcript_8339/g.11472  ORF Transcript_8339/g.11472 Transcript_8339/m.11472 type:complete len:81 (-) Transcript_8339:145-387(-)
MYVVAGSANQSLDVGNPQTIGPQTTIGNGVGFVVVSRQFGLYFENNCFEHTFQGFGLRFPLFVDNKFHSQAHAPKIVLVH